MRCKGIHLFLAASALSVLSVHAEVLPEVSAAGRLDDINQHFTSSKPTVVMTYDVCYRFLKLNLLQVANATIETTEGFWRLTDTGEEIPCCVIDIRVQSPSAAAGADRGGRIFIDDRVVSVVTMPELETIYYLKMTDELLNPIFGAKKDVRYFHVYDLSSGDLDFFAQDYVKKLTKTSMNGAQDMAAQGKEVSRVLSMLSDVYHERCGPISPDSDFRIFVNCDSVAIPFAARSRRDHIEAFGGKYDALKVEVMPAREAPRGIRTRDFRVWATSFTEVADRTEDTRLQKLAAETPAWGMTPLIADYGLALGTMRCALISMTTRDSREKTFAEAGMKKGTDPKRLNL